MLLYHYYDKRSGPFRSLSELSPSYAEAILSKIRETRPNSQCAKRDSLYVSHRKNCESILRREFIKAGGRPQRDNPFYMVVDHSPWLSTWYEECGIIQIPAEEFDLDTLSFTYGDSMPTFSPLIKDGKEYRHRLYTFNEITEIIKKYGLPQDWNDEGKYGPERYIEVQVWSNETIARYHPGKKGGFL